METVELVIHQERKEKSEEVLDGVNDAVIIQLLSKNTIYSFVEGVLEKLQYHWALEKICR